MIGKPESADIAPRGLVPPVLRHRNFSLFFFGLLFSNTGTWMAQTAQAWLVYELTGSKLILGTVVGAFGIPMILFPFIGGVVADRIDRRRLLWITQAIAAMLALLLAVLVVTNLVTVWQIITITILSATVLAFDQPARQALLPDIVPHEDLRPAVALNSAVYTGGAFLGPAFAGVAVTQFGLPLAGVFFINAATFGSVMLALAAMNLPKADSSHKRQPVTHTVVEGLRFIARNELILFIMLFSVIISFFGRSFQALTPVFANDVLNVGLQGLGWMNSSPGAGALIGAFVIGMGVRLPANGRLALGSGVIFSLLLIAFALSTHFLLSVFLLFLIGLFGSAVMAASRTILQLAAPRELMGRVMSFNTIAVIGFGPVGGFFLGPLAEGVGAPLAILISAAVVLVVVMLLAIVSPALRGAD